MAKYGFKFTKKFANEKTTAVIQLANGLFCGELQLIAVLIGKLPVCSHFVLG
jgi:hypothetical protein